MGFKQVIPQIFKMIPAEKVPKKIEMIFLTQLRRRITGYFSASVPMFKLPAQPLKTNI